MIAYAPSRPEIQGLRLDEIGRRWGKDPVECAFDIIEAEKGQGYVILFQLDEADLRRALVHPHVMIGSDGSSLAATGPLSEGKPHPRSYGTFPRVLGRYARDEGVLSLPAAIRGCPRRGLVFRIAASSGLAPRRTWSLSRPGASPISPRMKIRTATPRASSTWWSTAAPSCEAASIPGISPAACSGPRRGRIGSR